MTKRASERGAKWSAIGGALALAVALALAGCATDGGAAGDGATARRSPLQRRFDLDKRSGPLELWPHRTTYVAGQWSSSPNPASSTEPGETPQPGELAFQLSAKSKLIAGEPGQPDFWIAYTQSARWQVAQSSGPIRAIDHEPEAFFTLPIEDAALGPAALRVVGGGFVHQSNGGGADVSREWNRLYALAGVDLGASTSLLVRPWWRLPTAQAGDPDEHIDRYLGRGDLLLEHDAALLGKPLHLELLARDNLRASGNRGAIEVSAAWPIWPGKLDLFARAFSGYGDTLIDFDHRQTIFALGISVAPWR